jgi:glyoxylase-like metal-dependent hydrolase (beta-lactamase superfamily II)
MVRQIDVMHLGRDRVIAAHETRGLIVDPGPESCLETLLGGLNGEPIALLLTHIHLDHAGASGALVERFPGLRVYVHEVGAPHLIDPEKLLRSAARLYGEENMDRLWGRVVPVPQANLIALRGGETAEGMRVVYTPGHASHHVCYLDEDTGDAFVGDVAGVRIPPAELTIPPTPPPDIDVEAWERSIELVRAWRPDRLRLTHFGPVAEVDAQLDAIGDRLRRWSEVARPRNRAAFLRAVDAELGASDPDTADRIRQAAPPEQLWMGLERYWRKRGDQAA